MVDKKHLEISSYVLGTISIVLAFFQPLAGFIFGVIGFKQSKQNKTPLSKQARKLNKIGMILSFIIFAVWVTFGIISLINGIGSVENFPI